MRDAPSDKTFVRDWERLEHSGRCLISVVGVWSTIYHNMIEDMILSSIEHQLSIPCFNPNSFIYHIVKLLCATSTE